MKACGWAALASYAAVNSDDKLNIATYATLLDRVEREVHHMPDRLPFVMNGFVIAIGSYIPALTEKQKKRQRTWAKLK